MSATVGAKNMAGEVATFSTLGILILNENPKIQHAESSPIAYSWKISKKLNWHSIHIIRYVILFPKIQL